MSLFKSQSLTVKRYSAGSRNATTGLWEEGSTMDIGIKATVQPAKGNDMLSLPEGKRESETYRVYTSTLLQTVKESDKVNADRIELFTGKIFEVVGVDIWQNKVIPHYKALLSLIDA